MDIFEDFEEMKSELREKWLDYYEINHNWIKAARLSQGMAWNVMVNGNQTTIYCPSSALILGVVSSLDKRITSFIQISEKLSGSCTPDQLVIGLGLRFNMDAALEERQRKKEQKEDVQEAKLLTASGEDYTDPLLEELRREAKQNIIEKS